MTAAPQRETGSLARWNDDRGFGFIVVDGKPDVFVHISDFVEGTPRPSAGQEFRFTRTTVKGKEQAADVEPTVFVAAPTRRPHRRWPVAAAILVGSVFVAALVFVQVFYSLPTWVFWLYGIASVVTFVLYAVDKWAATHGAWRVSEGTLLILGLLGGWPGGLLAQEVLRHKTLKKQFRQAFWGTVVINVLIMAIAGTPLGPWLVDLVVHIA
jgi:uncharacterized membrane protein YsdA (DUF1294 family)/cold shock CspA family protein